MKKNQERNSASSKSKDSKKGKQGTSIYEVDISETVIDDGYLDILEDKKTAIFLVGAQRSLERNFNSQKVDAERIVETIPQISNYCEVEVHEFTNAPSASMTPERMLELSKKVQKELYREDICGAVIVHGGDTLEETAYFLGISLAEHFQTTFFKPIVFTPANNQSTDLFDNLAANLLASIRIACHDFKEAAPQVLICVNGEIYGAKYLRRTKTTGSTPFAAPGWGAVGHVYRDSISIRSGSVHEDVGLNFPTPEQLTAQVALVKAVTGDNGEVVDLLAGKGVDGIIVEGFGWGNLPATMMDSIRKAIDQGVIVVAGTRCEEGRVLDDNEFNGSVADLIQAGALTAGETDPAKARLLLLYILSQPDALKLKEENPQLFKAFLQECLDPVLADRLFPP